MILNFKVTNFFSFAEKALVSFELNDKVPDSDLVTKRSKDSSVRLSKMMAVIGPNASGKTNLLKALVFIGQFVARSFSSTGPNDRIPVEPHFFSDSEDSEFEIEFLVNGSHYRYELVVNKKYVVRELLYQKPRERFSYIFRRNWSKAEGRYNISQKYFDFLDDEAAKVRQNASLIATAAQYNVPLAQNLVSYFSNIYTNLSYGSFGNFEALDVFLAAEYFHSQPSLRKKMVNVLTNLDFGLVGVDIKTGQFKNIKAGDDEGVEIYVPFGVHRDNGKRVNLPFIKESNGTQMALILMQKILPALENGGIVVIDELESKLHPDVILSIVEMFMSSDLNPHNAQIIFTCHAHEILNDLEKEQIQLVEKTAGDKSETWRLSDVNKVRRDDNLFGKYRAGVYGAVPHI